MKYTCEEKSHNGSLIQVTFDEEKEEVDIEFNQWHLKVSVDDFLTMYGCVVTIAERILEDDTLSEEENSKNVEEEKTKSDRIKRNCLGIDISRYFEKDEEGDQT